MTLRLPIEMERELENLSVLRDIDKSKIIRELLIKGLKEARIEHSLKLYTMGKVSLWKAAPDDGNNTRNYFCSFAVLSNEDT